MVDIQEPLPSPGVGARRKGPKSLPRLPESAFSAPGSSASDAFPLPPSPSTIHPSSIIDGTVYLKDGKLPNWTGVAGRANPVKVNGIVVALPPDAEEGAVSQLLKDHPSLKVLSVLIPVSFEQGVPSNLPTFGGDVKTALSIKFAKNSPRLVEGLKWALEKGYVVDIEVQATVSESGQGWEGLEELLEEVLGPQNNDFKVAPGGAIILSNILPPVHDMSISIVKLLNHPSYHAYQSITASLSLYTAVFIRYSPPRWGSSVPGSPKEGTDSPKGKNEWKRRIKMFLGLAVEAFGYQRIIYGSSDPVHDSDPSDWYELARESLTELGVDQEGVDAVFGTTATSLYSA